MVIAQCVNGFKRRVKEEDEEEEEEKKSVSPKESEREGKRCQTGQGRRKAGSGDARAFGVVATSMYVLYLLYAFLKRTYSKGR